MKINHSPLNLRDSCVRAIFGTVSKARAGGPSDNLITWMTGTTPAVTQPREHTEKGDPSSRAPVQSGTR